MIVQRASAYDWAYSEQIPGSRCGPEDGPWPRSYQVLDEADIWNELTVLAKPQSKPFDDGTWKADSINFQPCPRTRTQDRYVVQQLDIHGRMWTLTGVFDGHLGDTTVEHVAHHLPIIIRDFLLRAFSDSNADRVISPEYIAATLSRSIIAFDKAIANDVLDLFPGGIAGLADLGDDEIRATINDQHRGGANYKKARLCMYGTTALVALVDPDHTNLWVANVGDCQAVFVTPDEEDDDWKVEVLTVDQNGDNPAEVERVRREHPGEPEAVLGNRVLGALAPFRCIGDVPFKQPPEFSRRILYNLFPGFHDTSPWEEFLARNLTPPYLSAEPVITHRKLTSTTVPRYLILCSDGFVDLCSSSGQQRIITKWARGMQGVAVPKVGGGGGEGKSWNMALRLLRESLGGEDRAAVSRVLTLDMDIAWIDDTTIVVQTL